MPYDPADSAADYQEKVDAARQEGLDDILGEEAVTTEELIEGEIEGDI